MAFYFVTGKLGNGKTLVSVSRIKDYLERGRMVATNIDVDLEAMFGPMAKGQQILRIPDKPVVADLHAIGKANTGYDESENGLLVLDECGTWFNSRNWKDKTRLEVNTWFLHARKLGWDVILIVQDVSIVDSQAREALTEFVAFCKRLDNLRVPIIGGLFKTLTGKPLTLPKVHIARVVYGATPSAPVADRWVYRGTDLFNAYDTKQLYTADYPHGVHSVLPPWYHNHQTRTPRDWDFVMRLTRIYLKKLKQPVSIVLGIAAGVLISYGMTRFVNHQFYDEYAKLIDAMNKLEQVKAHGNLAAPPKADLSIVEGYRISGVGIYSGTYVYDLQKPDMESLSGLGSDKDTPVPVISSLDLEAMFTVEPVSRCHLRLQSGDQTKDVYCL